MKTKLIIFSIFISVLMVGCSGKSQQAQPKKSPKVISTSITSKDDSIKTKRKVIVRAEGVSRFGKITISASDDEQVGKLGANSSYGKASDYTYNSDYNVIFKTLSGKENIIGVIGSNDIPVIIQPKDSVINLQKLMIDGNEVFIFLPQYSGSNVIPLYAFCVNKKGEAAQLKFQYEAKYTPIDAASVISTTSPQYKAPYVESNMLVIKTLMSMSDNSPELKPYKLTFKVNNEILTLVSKELVK